MNIKLLSLNSKIIFPLTVSEAVLVKKGTTIITLDLALSSKLESVEPVAGGGLNTYQQGTTVLITHSNPSITPNETPKPLLLLHDAKGHIVATEAAKSFIVTVDGQLFVESNGAEEKVLPLGDDFTVDNNNIALKWNNI